MEIGLGRKQLWFRTTAFVWPIAEISNDGYSRLIAHLLAADCFGDFSSPKKSGSNVGY
jgi:hypothetical protein